MFMATPEENAEAEAMLSDARVKCMQHWRAELRKMRAQIDGLLKEIEDAEYALA